MTLLDTAEIYGSEPLVAKAILNRRREDFFIATKAWSNHLRRDALVRAFEKSLKRLGTSYIDLYQVHRPNPKVPIRETMAAMEELVRDGRIRYIGVSNFNVEQTNEARDVLSKSELVSNQVEYSLRSRAVEDDILPYCRREKLTLIAYTPLARGNVPEAIIPRAICEKYGMTPIQVMLNWVTRSECVVAIPKSADIRHVEENASSVSARFSEGEYQTIGNG